MNKHDTKIRNTYGIALRTVVDRLVKTFDRATPSDIEEGAEWYPLAAEYAADLALQSHRSKECCAAVIAHLSPRMRWERNVLAAHVLLVDKEMLPGVMARSGNKALEAIQADECSGDRTSWEPYRLEATFGRDAKKTLRFYQNIMGDHEVVTVDIWALRAARLDGDDKLIQRAGVYEAVEYAYQVASRRKGVSPATFQATVWVVTKGGRA